MCVINGELVREAVMLARAARDYDSPLSSDWLNIFDDIIKAIDDSSEFKLQRASSDTFFAKSKKMSFKFFCPRHDSTRPVRVSVKGRDSVGPYQLWSIARDAGDKISSMFNERLAMHEMEAIMKCSNGAKNVSQRSASL